MEAAFSAKITLAELAELLQELDPAVLLLPRRILRRVMWKHSPRQAHRFRLFQSSRFVLDKQSLLQYLDLDEIAPRNPESLPEQIILLAQPRELLAGPQPRSEILLPVWRHLFHTRVQLGLEEKFARDQVKSADVQKRIERIGATEFAEITTVLVQEGILFFPDDPVVAYIQFVAQFLELHYFAPKLLPIYFPSLTARTDVEELVKGEVDSEKILAQTRPPETPEPHQESKFETGRHSLAIAPTKKNAVSDEEQHRLTLKAIRAESKGNLVRAALVQTKIEEGGEPNGESTSVSSKEFLRRLVDRLQAALSFAAEEKEQWVQALLPLLPAAGQGYWPLEARLLYDLQKVCLDHERELISFSPMRWVVTLGKQPIRKHIPGRQLVLQVKHLRSALKRFRTITLAPPERERLETLLNSALHQQEEKVRSYFRPLILESLHQVRLEPQNLPEQVSRDKLCEELLDRINEHGILTMSDLRDAISRNQVKLDDLHNPVEFLGGDKLLRLNSELAAKLENVYRPGEFYLRWMQSLSSLAFGTQLGRLLVKYLLIPFGGAFFTLKFCFFMYQEVTHFLPHRVEEHPTPKESSLLWDPITTPWSAGLFGLFLFLMIHVPAFRQRVFAGFRWVGKGLHNLFVDFPARLFQLPLVRALWNSGLVQFARLYLLKPLVPAALVALLANYFQEDMVTAVVLTVSIYVVFLLFLLSRTGRMVDEIVTNWVLDSLHQFGFQWVPALVTAIWDLFKWLVATMERVLYTIDEWFRFRRGENIVTHALKAFFGFFWLCISYVVRLMVILFIEPSINPIKHFPVVTVAAKFILVLIPGLIAILDRLHLDPAISGLIISFVILVVPGIFGFLVWELKENWRLYRANRPRTLQPVLVGHHGESMLTLLRPGFHSGTIPKTFAKWRRAVQRSGERSGYHYENQLVHIEESIRHFLNREFLHLLHQSRLGSKFNFSVSDIHLGVTQIRGEVACQQFPGQPLLLAFDLKSRDLLAKIISPGWLEQLSPPDQQLVHYALSGLYRLAKVASQEPIPWEEWVTVWEKEKNAPGNTNSWQTQLAVH